MASNKPNKTARNAPSASALSYRLKDGAPKHVISGRVVAAGATVTLEPGVSPGVWLEGTDDASRAAVVAAARERALKAGRASAVAAAVQSGPSISVDDVQRMVAAAVADAVAAAVPLAVAEALEQALAPAPSTDGGDGTPS